MNTPPYFIAGELLEQIIDLSTDDSGSFSYTLPEYADDQGQEVSVEIEGLDDTFMSFADGIISFVDIKPEHGGNYTLTVKLLDDLRSEISYELVI